MGETVPVKLPPKAARAPRLMRRKLCGALRSYTITRDKILPFLPSTKEAVRRRA